MNGFNPLPFALRAADGFPNVACGDTRADTVMQRHAQRFRAGQAATLRAIVILRPQITAAIQRIRYPALRYPSRPVDTMYATLARDGSSAGARPVNV